MKLTSGRVSYLNNIMAKDQRDIERRICLKQGFKSFRWAQEILVGIELV